MQEGFIICIHYFPTPAISALPAAYPTAATTPLAKLSKASLSLKRKYHHIDNISCLFSVVVMEWEAFELFNCMARRLTTPITPYLITPPCYWLSKNSCVAIFGTLILVIAERQGIQSFLEILGIERQLGMSIFFPDDLEILTTYHSWATHMKFNGLIKNLLFIMFISRYLKQSCNVAKVWKHSAFRTEDVITA